jgi:hypothetical protein
LKPVTFGRLEKTFKAGPYYVWLVQQGKPLVGGAHQVIDIGASVLEGHETWCELAAVRGRT